jgi:hypothetical protein
MQKTIIIETPMESGVKALVVIATCILGAAARLLGVGAR